MNGVKTNINGDFCAYCNAKVNVPLYDFCPKCGSALSLNAINLKEQQNRKIKLEVLDELSLEIKDEESLKILLQKIKNI